MLFRLLFFPGKYLELLTPLLTPADDTRKNFKVQRHGYETKLC